MIFTKILTSLSKKFILALFILMYIFSFVGLSEVNVSKLLKTSSTRSLEASAVFSATGSNLIVGNEATTTNSNTGGWRGTTMSDNNNWEVTRVIGTPSLNLQLNVDGIRLMNANKLLVTIEDSTPNTSFAISHFICDWVSSTGVDSPADAQCTGGGWRNLNPRRQSYSGTTDVTRVYEVYNGYFSTRVTTPGSIVSTPLSNFIQAGNNRALIRIFSTASSSQTTYSIDNLSIEPAIDPFYEISALTINQGTANSQFVSDLVGASSTSNVNANDSNRLRIDMTSVSTPIDLSFQFSNVRRYTGANTILVNLDFCVSNVALTWQPQLYNFSTSSWTSEGVLRSGTGCATDGIYAISFNSYNIAGFEINNHISNQDTIILRILTNTPSVVYNLQLDRIYLLYGSVNDNSSQCEISFGTGTVTNCQNTRIISGVQTGIPQFPTWQQEAVLEYPSNFYPLDNDDDTTDGEYASSSNISFPVTVDTDMSVTGVHYAAKYRSNSTALIVDLQVKDYGISTIGSIVAQPWINTPGADTNALTTYGFFDSWNLLENRIAVDDMIDTVNNLTNLRLRTSGGTTTNPINLRDWAFAMMSIRWVEDVARNTIRSIFIPTSGNLVTGTQVATGQNSMGWRGALGYDSLTPATTMNLWRVARVNPGGLNAQLSIDGVELNGANKLIIQLNDGNATGTDTYFRQICDFVSSVGVDHPADAQCPTGGWRTLNSRRLSATTTNATTSLIYVDIYDGFFRNTDDPPDTPISTPLTNFVESTNKRVLIRYFSTVNSTNGFDINALSVEAAIDPVYDPFSLTRLNSWTGTITNRLTDIVNSFSASDNSRITLTNQTSTPMDFYLDFENVKPYSGANTIVVRPEISTATTMNLNIAVYNFQTTSWTIITPTAIVVPVTASEAEFAYSLNNVTLSNYISNSEIRVRLFTTDSSTATLSIDRLYIMIGSTNTDTSQCYISWGSGIVGDCIKTRDVGSTLGGTTAIDSWNITSGIEYPINYWSLDNDDDATNGEYAFSPSLSMPITLTPRMNINSIHFAARFRNSAATGYTTSLSLRNYSNINAYSAAPFGVIGAIQNSNNVWVYQDSNLNARLGANSTAYIGISTVENLGELKIRTTASAITTPGDRVEWDFAMLSIRYLQKSETAGTLFTDIVNSSGDSVASPSLSFNILDTTFQCQTTTAIFGTSSERIRVSNSTPNPRWVLSIAPSLGSNATWSSGISTYDFNETSGSPTGCVDGLDPDIVGGRMSLNFNSVSITPQSGCSTTGLTIGSNTSFDHLLIESVTIIQAGNSAQTNCFWDITNIQLTQLIPIGQESGNYSINMTLTVLSD